MARSKKITTIDFFKEKLIAELAELLRNFTYEQLVWIKEAFVLKIKPKTKSPEIPEPPLVS